MDRRTGKRIMKVGTQSVMVSFRCKKDLKKKIENKAEHMGVRESKFISDCIEAGVKRRSRYDKGKVNTLVKMQEDMNHIVMEFDGEQGDLKEQVLEFMERTMKLWEF